MPNAFQPLEGLKSVDASQACHVRESGRGLVLGAAFETIPSLGLQRHFRAVFGDEGEGVGGRN